MSCRTQLYTELNAFSRLMTGILKRQLYSHVYYHVLISNIAVHVSLKVKGRDDISSNYMLYGNYHTDKTDIAERCGNCYCITDNHHQATYVIASGDTNTFVHCKNSV